VSAGLGKSPNRVDRDTLLANIFSERQKESVETSFNNNECDHG